MLKSRPSVQTGEGGYLFKNISFQFFQYSMISLAFPWSLEFLTPYLWLIVFFATPNTIKEFLYNRLKKLGVLRKHVKTHTNQL